MYVCMYVYIHIHYSSLPPSVVLSLTRPHGTHTCGCAHACGQETRGLIANVGLPEGVLLYNLYGVGQVLLSRTSMLLLSMICMLSVRCSSITCVLSVTSAVCSIFSALCPVLYALCCMLYAPNILHSPPRCRRLVIFPLIPIRLAHTSYHTLILEC